MYLLCFFCIALIGCVNADLSDEVPGDKADGIQSETQTDGGENEADPEPDEKYPEEVIEFDWAFDDGRVIFVTATLQDTNITPYYRDVPKALFPPEEQDEIEGDFVSIYFWDTAEFYVKDITYRTDDDFSNEEKSRIESKISLMKETDLDTSLLEQVAWVDAEDKFEWSIDQCMCMIEFIHDGNHGRAPDKE